MSGALPSPTARLVGLVGVLVAALGGCWLDGDLKQRRTTVPEPLDDGWEIATPESVGLDPAALARLHDEILREDRHTGMTGLLVVKDGKLVWETYLRSPADRDRIENRQSITKSITSLAVGISIARGELPGVGATVADLFPDESTRLDEVRRSITLGDLLTMRSGLDLDNDHFSIDMWVDRPREPLHYMLSRPLYADPGERFFYRDLDPQVVGYALTHATGRSEEGLVRERLFEPLGITDAFWPAGDDGVNHGADSLHLRARDLARFGQLCLQRGTWEGVELVPAAWIDDATSPHVATRNLDDRGEPIGYGYYFWVVSGLGYSMVGHGAQYVFVSPAHALVVVAIGHPDAELHGSTVREFVPLVRLIVSPLE